MKRLVSVLIVALLLVGCMTFTAFAGGTAAMTAELKTAGVGEEVTLSVVTSPVQIKGFRIVLSYDSDSLELVSVEQGAAAVGIFNKNTTTPGTIKANCIHTELYDAEGALLVAKFRVKDTATPGQTYPVTIIPGSDATRYSGAEGEIACTPTNGGVSVPVPAHEHTWVEDVSKRVDPTCESAGSKSYYCSVAGCTETKTEAWGTPLGHDWDTPTYDWAADNSSVTGKCVCKRDASHVETETVSTTSTSTATCEGDGVRTFVAKFTKDCFTEQRKEVADSAFGHDWNAPTYTWSEDNKTVTAKRICKNDAAHVETETVNTTVSDKVDPTCTADGKQTFTATFRNPAFEPQVKRDVKIDKLGHDWGAWTNVNPETGEKDASKHYRQCARCQIWENAPHNWHWVDDPNGTTKHEECEENCGAKRSEGTLIKQDPNKDKVHKTGDITPQIVMGAVAVVAVVMGTVFVIKRKTAR